MHDHPAVAAEQDPSDAGADTGVSRRRLLRTAGIATGAAWVVPSVLSMTAVPAGASPMGCTVCGTQIAINCTGSSLMGWTAVGSNAWTTTGTVFQGQVGFFDRGTRERPIFNFSAACVARLAVPPSPANPLFPITLAGRLRGNTANITTTIFRVEFFALANAAGAVTGTLDLTSTSGTLPGTPTSIAGTIPQGTRSMRIRVLIANSFAGSPGQAANLTVAIGAC